MVWLARVLDNSQYDVKLSDVSSLNDMVILANHPLPFMSQLWQCAMPQMWKSYPARELNPRSSAVAAVALTTELLSWDGY